MLSELAGDWRLWLVLGAIALMLVAYRIRPSRRKPRIARLPRSLVREKRRPLGEEQSLRSGGPVGGDATRLADLPAEGPTPVAASSGPINPPPAEKAATAAAPLPPEPDIVIDLTALESEETIRRPRSVVDLRDLQPIEPLPADPWA